MSCGNAHETPCTEVLESLILFIDKEQCLVAEEQIRIHLAQCPSCCSERDAMELMKVLVSRSCYPDPAPSEFRLKITQIIAQIQVESAEGS